MVEVEVKVNINSPTEKELLAEDDDNVMMVEGSNLSFAEETALLADEEDKKQEESSDSGITTGSELECDLSSKTDLKSPSGASPDPTDDEIIILDDDANDSGIEVSSSKKARKESDTDSNEMDVDSPIATEEAKSIQKIIRKMTRKELENLVLAKIVEAIVSNTEAGQLRSKVVELQIQKDKIANKMGMMMKQVAQLSAAVTTIIENESRDPKNRIGKPGGIVRFTRSVGLQTTIESSVKSAPPNLIRIAEPNAKMPNVVFRAPQQPSGVKRAHPGNGVQKPMGNLASAIATQATGVPAKKVQIANPLPTPKQNAEPGIVDLTDDDPPPQKPAPAPVNVPNKVVQYRVLNNNPPQNTQLRQIAPKMIALPQIRSVPLQQQVGNSQRLVFQLAGTITGGKDMVGVPVYAQKRFTLPPLPAAPPHKTRNDKFKVPPKPQLTLLEQADGIVLSWTHPTIDKMAEVANYQIFACQEYLANSNKACEWKRVGEVKALPLPMACTLSQFVEENRYYFIVRGVDVYDRVGPFCDPQCILLRVKK